MDIKEYLVLFYENNDVREYTGMEIVKWIQRYLEINDRAEERSKFIGFYKSKKRAFHTEMKKYHRARGCGCSGLNSYFYTLKKEFTNGKG